MAKRDNHYEAAFEAWLRSLEVPYVAVDEAHRSPGPAQTLKNVDFIVSPVGLPIAEPRSWLVDVKGRQFPTAKKQFWRNWSTADELSSLANWEQHLGPAANGLLVFAYNVVGDRAPLPAEELFVHQRRGLVVPTAQPAHRPGARPAVVRAKSSISKTHRLSMMTHGLRHTCWP